MSAKDNSGGDNLPSKDSKSQSLKDELDLDKNPIKYATHETDKYVLDPHDKDYMELTLRSGKHSELVQRLMRQRLEARAKEFPRWPANTTSGVRFMWIESRFWYDRERLSPDFDQDWREYRAKYLHSLELHPTEPIHVPEYEKALINPLKRFYQKPGDWLERNFWSRITKDKYQAQLARVTASRYVMLLGLVLAGSYWIRYHSRDWHAMYGPYIQRSKPIIYPNDPNFPFKDYRTEPAHHALDGFPQRTIFKDLRDYEDITHSVIE